MLRFVFTIQYCGWNCDIISLMDLFRLLERIRTWHFVLVAVLMAEIFTLVLNSLRRIFRWGMVSMELVEIGAIDTIFVSVIITFITIAYR